MQAARGAAVLESAEAVCDAIRALQDEQRMSPAQVQDEHLVAEELWHAPETIYMPCAGCDYCACSRHASIRLTMQSAWLSSQLWRRALTCDGGLVTVVNCY